MDNLIIPSSFEDALSYGEQVLWFYNYLQKLAAEAAVRNDGGEPAVEVQVVNGEESATLDFVFKNVIGRPGEPGRDGRDGVTPDISADATISDTIGVPTVNVTKTGTTEAPVFHFAFHNLKGAPGQNGYSPSVTVVPTSTGHTVSITDAQGTASFTVEDGEDGIDGIDGFSPIVSITEITGGHQVTITDANGSQTFNVMDGVDGSDGSDGFSPSIAITNIPGGHQVSVTDATGTSSFNVMDGNDGSDGFSPSITVTDITGGHTLTITDANGTRSFNIMDGAAGQNGSDGVSPTVTTEPITGGTRVTITDATGDSTFDMMDGDDGDDGNFWWNTTEDYAAPNYTFDIQDLDGVSGRTPAVGDLIVQNVNHRTYVFYINTVGSTTVLSDYLFELTGATGPQGEQGIPGTGEDGVGISNIAYTSTDAQGNYVYTVTLSNSQTYTITCPRGPQGQTGGTGQDGVSPTIMITDITGGHQVSITDAQGTSTFNVMDGATGQTGQSGSDGVSPTVSITNITGGHRLSITDAQGTSTADIMDGSNGANGVSPTVSVTSITGGHRISITDAQGTSSVDVMDGAAGTNGTNGVSPTVSITSITGGHRLTIVDANGTSTADIMDGQNGSPGATGATPVVSATATVGTGTGTPSVTVTKSGTDAAPSFAFAFDNLKGANGQGVPTGGTQGQVLTKSSGTDYDTTWADSAGLPKWGSAGQFLVKRSNTDYDVDWAYAPSGASLNYQTFDYESDPKSIQDDELLVSVSSSIYYSKLILIELQLQYNISFTFGGTTTNKVYYNTVKGFLTPYESAHPSDKRNVDSVYASGVKVVDDYYNNKYMVSAELVVDMVMNSSRKLELSCYTHNAGLVGDSSVVAGQVANATMYGPYVRRIRLFGLS